MKTKYLIFWLCISPFLALSQTWSEPKTIFTEGLNRYPDITIDNNGVMHCVWAHKLQTNYWKILYSKSTDSGHTWSSAQDISLNANLWMYNPQIVADADNNLYVSYDHNTGNPNASLILMKKYDGIQWCEPDTISVGLPGSMHSRLAVDYNNKLYCFWYNGISGGKIFQRTLENGIWSIVYQPYSGNNDHYFLNSVKVDQFNNLHCAGAHHFSGQSGYDDRAVYFKCLNGVWGNYIELSNNTTWDGLEIALDTNNFPSITWGQYTSHSVPPNEGSFVASFNGSGWDMPQLLVEDHPDEQVIAIDKFNNIYIIDNEKGIGIYSQVCYKKLLNDVTIETINQNTLGFYDQILLASDTALLLGYIETENNTDYSIKLRTSTIITDIQKHDRNIELSIFPNPLFCKTQILYKTTQFDHVQIKILNFEGQLVNVLVDENKTPGKYSINWEGNDLNGKEVSPGLYLVRLQVGRHVVTRSVILVK